MFLFLKVSSKGHPEEGGREEEKEREGGREGGREGEREGEKEREGGREGGGERERDYSTGLCGARVRLICGPLIIH